MHYPARFGGGSGSQILQFYGQDTLARRMSAVVYEGHYISNHHPVLLTWMYGAFFKAGNLLGDTNSAVFLLSCTILAASSFCMAYMLIKLKKYTSCKVYAFLFIFVCVHPVFGTYSYTCCKDNLFADALILFYVFILEVIVQKGAPFASRRFVYAFIGVSLVIPFLKNQGILIVVISLLAVAVFEKKIRKRMAMQAGIVVFVYVALFSHMLLPALKIAPGGKQEALSVPFQQTALYVQSYGQELSQEERDTINAVLPVDELASLYVADRADSVKNRYRQEACLKDLANYCILWAKQFFRHPGVYFRAFFLLTDGYYDLAYDEAILDLYEQIPVDAGLTGAQTPQWVINFVLAENAFWEFLVRIPLVGCFFRVSAYAWVMIVTFFYILYSRQVRWLLIMLPVILNFLITLLCPWNGVVRYALPVIYALPVCICILGMEPGQGCNRNSGSL